MMSSTAFALANLILWVGLLIGLAVKTARERDRFWSRHRGIRYRRMPTADVLKIISKDRVIESGEKIPDDATTARAKRGRLMDQMPIASARPLKRHWSG